jgi:hypothetical protein
MLRVQPEVAAPVRPAGDRVDAFVDVPGRRAQPPERHDRAVAGQGDGSGEPGGDQDGRAAVDRGGEVDRRLRQLLDQPGEQVVDPLLVEDRPSTHLPTRLEAPPSARAR